MISRASRDASSATLVTHRLTLPSDRLGRQGPQRRTTHHCKKAGIYGDPREQLAHLTGFGNFRDRLVCVRYPKIIFEGSGMIRTDRLINQEIVVDVSAEEFLRPGFQWETVMYSLFVPATER